MKINNLYHMKKTFYLFLLLTLMNLFFSCVALPSSSMKTSMSIFNKEGMIAGTFSLQDKNLLTSYTLHYIQIEAGAEKTKFVNVLNTPNTTFMYNRGEVKFGNSKGDFKENEKDVYLFNIVEPAGKYRIYELEMFHNSGSLYMQYTKKMPLDITFEIEEGKIKYFGEINISVKDQKIKLINNIERDRIKFNEKNSEITF